MEGGDGEAFAHVEPVGVGAAGRGVEVEHAAPGVDRPSAQLGQQFPAHTVTACVFRGDQVVDVELEEGGRRGDDPPTGHPHTPPVHVRGGEPQPLRVAPLVDGRERFRGEVGPQLSQHGQDVGLQAGVAGVKVDKGHDSIVARSVLAIAMSDRTQELGAVWNLIADTSFGVRAPLYDRIARAVARDDDVLTLVLDAPPEGHFPLLLLAAVHYVVLGGLDHALAAVYRGHSDADPAPLFRDVCLSHRSEIVDLLSRRHVQTNEVGRSAFIGPALAVASDRLGERLALVDVGASAGLNLRCDRYLLDYGDHGTTGPSDAAVRVECEVVGGRPPIRRALPPIDGRIGIDRAPADVTDPDDARWLLACVWPEMHGRLSRAEKAIREAAADPPAVVKGDAFDAVPDAVRAIPTDVTVCVSTFWTYAYFPVHQRPAFTEMLLELARTRPLVWLYGEGPSVGPAFGEPPDECVLGLVFFERGDPEPVFLAQVQPHGEWMRWVAS